MLSDVTADDPVWNYSILTAWWVNMQITRLLWMCFSQAWYNSRSCLFFNIKNKQDCTCNNNHFVESCIQRIWTAGRRENTLRVWKGWQINIVSIDNHPYLGNINAKIYIYIFTTKDCAEMNTKLLQNHAQNWVFVKKKNWEKITFTFTF